MAAVAGLVVPALAGAAPDRYIVVLKDGASAPAAAFRHGAPADAFFSSAIDGYAGPMTGEQLRAAAADPQVLYVSPDRMVTTGRPGGGGGGGTTSTQVTPTGITRIGNAASRRDGVAELTDVDVAVIDTGIDLAHPDLNVVGGYNCSSGSTYADGNGHGSHVAGTIGARDNSFGVVGVAPGARLWSVRVLNNSGSGTTSAIICGIDWVTANASTIEVANMSIGGVGSDDGNCGNSNNDALHRAVCATVAAGVTLVVAAGNDAKDAALYAPASYDEAITVSAWADFNGAAGGGAAATCRVDVDDTFASFSNYGGDVDIAAPGVCIRSTWKGGGYNTISGTSMASPHVAGAAALYKAQNPSATPAAVKSALKSHADATAPSDDPDGNWEGLLSLAGWL